MNFNEDSVQTIKQGNEIEKDWKVVVLIIIMVAIFSLFGLKLFSMQVLEGEAYRSRSVNISSRSKTLLAQRGEIFDRNSDSPLVISNDSFAVDITPGEIPKGQYDTVAGKLAALLGLSKLDIDAKIPQSIRSSFSSVEIKSKVPFSEITNIAENSVDLPGVSWRSKPIRSYLDTGSLSHVIGYVGDITRDELKLLYNKGYTSTSVIGKSGIEKQYDSILQGKSGTESQTVDVRGRLISAEPVIEAPEMGKNLVLTIDSTIQKLTEQALGKRVGAAVVLNAGTGEILSMASYPYFDANTISAGNISNLENVENNPLLNRVIDAVYPPASTFKIVMTTAVLAENAFPKERAIECTGSITYGGRTFHCHVFPNGHGYMDLKNGLAQSCNVYFWSVGRDNLGVDQISRYAGIFGIGRPLEIDLPVSSSGFMPTAQWKERRYHEKWVGGDTMAISIGQGYTLVTPLHMANVAAMVANGGKIYRPHLLKEIRDPVTNEVISEIKPEILYQAPDISQETWKLSQQYLRYAMTDGAARNTLGANHVVTFAAKTGTGEVAQYKDRWHSWLVAYAPFDAPPEETLVVCVLVEAVNPWEWWATYAANIILQGIYANQTYDQAVDALGYRYIAAPTGRIE
jgi:penicillin-binding protein 2